MKNEELVIFVMVGIFGNDARGSGILIAADS
jgi:hypothetical protein